MITEQSFDYAVPYQKDFNTGSGSSEYSILLKVLNAGDNTVVPSQLYKWVYRGCFWLIQTLFSHSEETDFPIPLCDLTAPVLSITIAMGGTMIDVTEEVNATSPAVESAQTANETEAKLTSDIKSLWSSHQTSKATAKRTKEELEDLRLDLGWKLSEMKSILVRTGRSGGWSAYLRSHGIPRGSAERNIKRYEALSNPETNRLGETISEPSEEDVRRLVRSLLPRLRKVLTTTRSISLFVDGVVQQLQISVGDLSGGTSGSGEVEMGDHSDPVVAKVPTVA
jgi:hypothetical protein